MLTLFINTFIYTFMVSSLLINFFCYLPVPGSSVPPHRWHNSLAQSVKPLLWWRNALGSGKRRARTNPPQAKSVSRRNGRSRYGTLCPRGPGVRRVLITWAIGVRQITRRETIYIGKGT